MTRQQYDITHANLSWVKVQIRSHPELYRQDTFCGSICCIGGWLHIKEVGYERHSTAILSEIVKTAIDSLGMVFCSTSLPWILDSVITWPEEAESTYYAAGQDITNQAEAACFAIDLWLSEQLETIT